MIKLTDLLETALDEVKKAKRKPSAGMTAKEKSAVVKKAKTGEDIGKKGRGFEALAKKVGGGKKGEAIAAAAMWKSEASKAKKKHVKECAGCDSEQSNDWTHGHDHEGSMAKSEIKDMIKNAVELHNMLGKNDELPGWASSYITLATDYIHTVTQHIAGKSDEMQSNVNMQISEVKAVIKHLIEHEIRSYLKEQDVKDGISSFEEDPLNYILKSYPTLKETLTMLMSEAFKDRLTGIYIVADKPTTFKILLTNGQEYLLTYLGKAYEATIQARRYYLMSIGEKESAIMAIRNLLLLGPPINAKGPGEEITSTTGIEEPPAETSGEEVTSAQEKEEETES